MYGWNGCELTAAITAAANAIAASATTEQLELLAAVFNQLGDTLATLAVMRPPQGGSGVNYLTE